MLFNAQISTRIMSCKLRQSLAGGRATRPRHTHRAPPAEVCFQKGAKMDHAGLGSWQGATAEKAQLKYCIHLIQERVWSVLDFNISEI